MKRFHLHVAVDNLADSVRFYSALFATEPSVQKSDYAKWMLDDPSGLAWETFHSLESIPVFGESKDVRNAQTESKAMSGCCIPLAVPIKQADAPCCVPTAVQPVSGGKCC